MRNTYVAAIDQGTTSSRCIVFDRGRRDRRRRPARAPADLPPARLGGARRRGDLGQRRTGGPRRAGRRRHRPGRAGRRRHHQPAGDHRGLGPGHRPAGRTTRSSGRTPAPAPLLRELAAAVRRGEASAPAPACRSATYFAGPKLRWLLDNVDGLRGARRARRGALRHHGQLADLEADRPARHRRHQRQPDHADEPATTLDWDDGAPRRAGHPGRRCCRRSAARPRSTATARRGARRGAGGRALGDQQAALFGQTCFAARRGQVHLRHRQLPAAQHRGQPGRRPPHGLLTTVGYRIDGQPAAYALEGAIAVTGSLVQWLRDNLGLISLGRRDRGAGRARVRRQRRLLRRAGLLRAVRAALAHRRPGRDRRADRLTSPGATWPGRRWRRPAGRPARWSTR